MSKSTPSKAVAGDELKQFRPPGFGAWLAIALVYQRHHRLLSARLKPLEVSVPQLDVLANLYGSEGLQQTELADRLLVTKANVTGLVARLLERGWVERTPDPSDGRAHRVALTRAGRRVAQRALEARGTLIEEVFSTLSSAQREALTDLANTVGAHLDELR